MIIQFFYSAFILSPNKVNKWISYVWKIIYRDQLIERRDDFIRILRKKIPIQFIYISWFQQYTNFYYLRLRQVIDHVSPVRKHGHKLGTDKKDFIHIFQTILFNFIFDLRSKLCPLVFFDGIELINDNIIMQSNGFK